MMKDNKGERLEGKEENYHANGKRTCGQSVICSLFHRGNKNSSGKRRKAGEEFER